MDEGAYLAEVRLFAGNFAPRGWAFCQGQVMAIGSNSALFSLIGTMYGGNGRTDFMLPKLDAPIKHLNYIICIAGRFPSRD